MINRVVIMGNLTKNPELKNTTNGKTVCSFTVAYNSYTKDSNGERVKHTSFIPCVAFGLTAEYLAKNARKGSLVAVEGKLSQRSFVRLDETKGSVLEVLCDSVQSLSVSRTEVTNEEPNVPPYDGDTPNDGTRNMDPTSDDDDNLSPF